MAVKPMTLRDLLAELDQYQGRIPLDELTQRLQDAEFTLEDVRPFLHFGTDSYRRNLMHAGPAYQALILCWRSGQRSPIHDHRGSSCGVRVLKGTVTETLFERTPAGHVYPTTTHELHEGGVCGSQDDDMHQVSNLQDGDLVTLHIYSPPLLVMGLYSLTEMRVREFHDPVCGFECGGGI